MLFDSCMFCFMFTHATIDFDFLSMTTTLMVTMTVSEVFAVVGVGENGCWGHHVVETYVGLTCIYCEIGLIFVFAACFYSFLIFINDAIVCTFCSCNTYSIVRL